MNAFNVQHTSQVKTQMTIQNYYIFILKYDDDDYEIHLNFASFIIRESIQKVGRGTYIQYILLVISFETFSQFDSLNSFEMVENFEREKQKFYTFARRIVLVKYNVIGHDRLKLANGIQRFRGEIVSREADEFRTFGTFHGFSLRIKS